MLRRLVLAVLVAPLFAGCMPYVFPTMAYTPEQPIENEDGSAHAFRVDIDRTERSARPTAVEFTLMKIPLDTRGIVPSQLELAPASGIYNPLHVGDSAEREHNAFTLHVRLYRPGYETKEIRAWGRAQSPKWVPARDLLAQEKALDDLLAAPTDPPAATTWWDAKENPSFQPGTVSVSQHDALMFASGEYQRLANCPMANAATMSAVKQRLIQKALFLSSFADQKAVPAATPR
jgi:hypothetical protein